MNRAEATEIIKASWKSLYPADRKRKGIVCPLCGSGSGEHGTGITGNATHGKPNSLKCWKCPFSGSVIDLIMQDKGLTFPEAVNDAAKVLGITIDDTPKATERPKNDFRKNNEEKLMEEDRTPQTGTEALQRPLEDFMEYYGECYKRLEDPAAVSYLSARGISTETARQFCLGYDPAWISPTVIYNQEAKGSSWRPEPTPRIIIPMNKNHYIARATDPGQKEYAKMNETGGGEIALFNERALLNKGCLFLTEGVFDALSVLEVGEQAMALNSTSNAPLFIELLKICGERPTVILCLDNDESGKKATSFLLENLRRLNISCITADICNGAKDPNEALTKDREQFAEAVRIATRQTAPKPDNTGAYIKSLEMQAEIKELANIGAKNTGFKELDKKSGGLFPGLYVVAATTSLGKTTFCLQLADNLAAGGSDVLFFSLEQSRLELVSKSLARILATEDKDTAPTSQEIRCGKDPEKVGNAAKRYIETMGDRLSIIEGNFNCTVSFVDEYVTRYVQENKCRPVVFIDYLQILQPEPGQRQTTKEAVDASITALKRLSRQHKISVICIASINRTNYTAAMSFESLKESGNIEYTCDVVWGLQQTCIYSDAFKDKDAAEKKELLDNEKQKTPRKISLQCMKNRYGATRYRVDFNYFPQNDLYTETDFAAVTDPTPFEETPKRKRL